MAFGDLNGEDIEHQRRLRKLRKKLRQIEHLQVQERERQLNEEEKSKVLLKDQIREEIIALYTESKMKRKTTENDECQKRRRSSENPIQNAEQSLRQEKQLEIAVPHSSSDNNPETTVSSTSQEVLSSDHVQVTLGSPDKRSLKKSSKKLDKAKWRQKNLLVQSMDDGHDDIVTCVAIDVENNIAITGSRDTKIIVWQLNSRKQSCNLRGHTAAISSVLILNAEDSCKFLGQKHTKNLVCLSGSLDCSLKIWDLSNKDEGKLIKSIYTYNGIKCLGFSPSIGAAISGTDGGKVEVFTLNDKMVHKTRHSILAHDDVITTLDVSSSSSVKSLLVTGSRDGIIKVWQISLDSLKLLFVSEDIQTATDDQAVHLRCILSLKFVPGNDNFLVYGDSGCNLKLLDWKNRILHKIPNHTSEMGFTDCISVKGHFLLASSYDLDNGLGHINMFYLRKNENPFYVCSWSDEDTTRIFSLDFEISSEGDASDVTLITAGKEIKAWQSIKDDLPNEDALLIRPSILALYSNSAVDSGSSSSDSDTAELSEDSGLRRNRVNNDTGTNSNWSCCII